MSDSPEGWKVTAAGAMPEDWSAVRLREIAKEQRTRAGNAQDYPVLSVTKHNGIVLAADYFNKAVHSRDTTAYKVVRPGEFAYATIHLDEGSIGLLRSATAGVVSPMYTVFKQTAGSPGFLLELLKSELYLQRYPALAKGSVNRRASISFRSLGSLALHWPPAAEQRAIANIMNSVRAAIEKTTHLVSELRSAKHQAMRELLTVGHPRFRTGMRPLSSTWAMGRVAPNITEIPAHWQIVQLTKVARLESGHTPSRKHPEYWGGDIPWLSLADTDQLKRSAIESTTEQITPAGVANSSARLLPADSVVLSRTAVRGLCSTLSRPMTTSQDFVVFVCGSELNSRYLMQLFRHMQREWRRLEQGSSPTNKTLYFRVFKKVKILLPPMEEQRAIGEVGDAFDARIEAEQDHLRALEDLKRGLARELLSGRVRIPAELIAKLNDGEWGVNV